MLQKLNMLAVMAAVVLIGTACSQQETSTTGTDTPSAETTPTDTGATTGTTDETGATTGDSAAEEAPPPPAKEKSGKGKKSK